MKFSFLTPLVSLFLLIPAFAQTPEETAEAYFDALKKKDYTAVASFMSTESLTEFRSFFDGFMELDADMAEAMMQQYLGDEVTPENIILLSDEEFFANFMENVMAQAGQFMEMSFDEQTILGKVPEGDDLVHLVARYKMTLNGSEMEQIEAVSMQKQGDSWKMTLTGDIKGMGEGIKASLQMMNVQ